MGGQIYGEEFLVYNVHGLLHLTADAKKFGSLEKDRSGKSRAVQIVKRVSERKDLPR